MTDRELNDAVRKAKAAALRDWRHRNPDKVREAQKRYWKNRVLRELEQEQAQQNTESEGNHAEAEADS